MNLSLSVYNYFIEWNNFHFGVNTLTGYKAFLTNDQYELLKEFPLNRAISLKFPTLYNQLKHAGFITANDVEFEFLKHRYLLGIYGNNGTYRLTIMPTLNCNLRCWYCYEHHSKSKMSPDTMRNIFRYVKYIIDTKNIRQLELDWFGGEPMMYFNDIVYPLSMELIKLAKKNKINT